MVYKTFHRLMTFLKNPMNLSLIETIDVLYINDCEEL